MQCGCQLKPLAGVLRMCFGLLHFVTMRVIKQLQKYLRMCFSMLPLHKIVMEYNSVLTVVHYIQLTMCILPEKCTITEIRVALHDKVFIRLSQGFMLKDWYGRALFFFLWHSLVNSLHFSHFNEGYRWRVRDKGLLREHSESCLHFSKGVYIVVWLTAKF